jgi:hypothetical protein
MTTNLSTFLQSTFQGSQGSQGSQGLQGTLGSQGLQGLSNQGVQGTIGSQGLQGTLGSQGLQGTQGAGSPGSQGLQGTQGTQGLQGTQGAGSPGSQGLQGTQGTQGFSPVGIPSSSNTTIASTDAGKVVIIDAGVTINTSTDFTIGDMCTIYNSGITTRSITATGVTLRFAGTSTTGNRFLSPKGLGNVLCVASDDYIISGAGLT